jgi:DNA-directed RNA polymerase specialized sigma24 family protein
MANKRNSPAELGIHELAVGRSPASFEEFFRTEQLRLHRVLFAITGSRQEAEDIGQEAFLRAWERWDRVSDMDDPAGYLHRTAINLFRDRSRRLVLGLRRVVRISPRRTNTTSSRHVRSLCRCSARFPRDNARRSC